MQDRPVFEQILGIVVLTYTQHRITNAVSEGLNSKIQWVKSTARGFRNNRTHDRRKTVVDVRKSKRPQSCRE